MEQFNATQSNADINNNNTLAVNFVDISNISLIPELNNTLIQPEISSESAPILNREDGDGPIPSILLDYFENDFPRYPTFRTSRRSALRLNSSESTSRFYSPFVLRYENFLQTSSDNVGEIENDNCFLLERNSKNMFGTLTMKTVTKLLNNKLMTFTIISERIYRKIFDVYFNNLIYEKEDANSMFKLTNLFMKCLPSLKYISNFSRKINLNSEKYKKNVFFTKLCLDVYEDYLKTFDFPLFRKYKNTFLDIALYFYTKISDRTITKINEQILISSMGNLKIKSNEFKNKKNYIDYYKAERLQFQGMYGGLEISKFIN